MSDRTGLLIIRAWVEPGSTEPVRAYVRMTADVAAGFQSSQTLSNAHDVCAAVGEWLTEVAGQQAEATDTLHLPPT